MHRGDPITIIDRLTARRMLKSWAFMFMVLAIACGRFFFAYPESRPSILVLLLAGPILASLFPALANYARIRREYEQHAKASRRSQS